MNLDWLKKIKKAMKNENVAMNSIYDLFTQLENEAESVHILMIGKSKH